MKTPDEIRAQILATVTRNGGHLASSLGAVELAMALVKVFEPTKDRIVWDVGHQAYAWKILTGRADRFETLRTRDGLSPFPTPLESAADAAVAGHAGSALSVAVGFAAARDRKGTDEQVVAVIGDASVVNGHSFEALNNLASATKKVIVILNDNEWSISRPAGSFARFLGHLTSGLRYNRAKNWTKAVARALRLGFLYRPVHVIKHILKRLFLGDVYFEQFGLHYLGPVDGHNLAALTSALRAAKDEPRSVLLHVVTKKGKGFAPAEADPTQWHGISGADSKTSGGVSWSDACGRALCDLARTDRRVVALTAAMKDGTGLARFAAEFPDRFFDVGIAEGHLVSFAAGLAGGGLRPVVAIYSTFLQRAIDQVMHDVAIANLPVIFCVDRAGVVGADGMTHQGVFDLAMLRCLPNLTICQPKDEEDLRALLAEALARHGPTLIRYPRGTVPASVSSAPAARATPAPHPVCALWTTGDWLPKAEAVSARIPGCEVVHARTIKPFDAARLAQQRAAGLAIISLENGSVVGGFGESIGADLRFGWPDTFIPHGRVDELERAFGLDVDSIVTKLDAYLKTLN